MKLLEDSGLRQLESQLQSYIPGRAAGFGGVARIIQDRAHQQEVAQPFRTTTIKFLFVVRGSGTMCRCDIERYLFATRPSPPATRRSKSRRGHIRHLIIARLRACAKNRAWKVLFLTPWGSRRVRPNAAGHHDPSTRPLKGLNGEVKGFSLGALHHLHAADAPPPRTGAPRRAEKKKSNSAILVLATSSS